MVENKRESDKLESDHIRAQWSAISSIIPIIVALLTLGYSIRLQHQAARLQFEIKAAEIAFAGKTPQAVENRAKILKKIFDKRLPDDFPGPFDGLQGKAKEPPAEKLSFLELLQKYPEDF
jgi:hypothetical protein